MKFSSLNEVLQFIIHKLLTITKIKTKQELSNFMVQLQILNFKRKKVFLELSFETKNILGQKCFLLYCYNKKYQ